MHTRICAFSDTVAVDLCVSNNHILTNIWKTGIHTINIPEWMARLSSFEFSLLSLEHFCKAKQKRFGDDVGLTFNPNFVGYSLLHSQDNILFSTFPYWESLKNI